MTYNTIKNLELVADCSQTSIEEWNNLMAGSIRANKKIINSLVKKFIPELYEALSLNLNNPYNYFKTKEHLILVHSGTEYFLKIN